MITISRFTICEITGREILDSRGNPTVESTVVLQNGVSGTAAVPSGASTGMFEAVELRDNDPQRYGGNGVRNAVRNINTLICDAVAGMPCDDQMSVDKAMLALDGTENKSRLGANAMLAVSLACARAAANELRIPLYRYIGGVSASVMSLPMMNILNGGAHASNNVDVQEFMIIPTGIKCYEEGIRGCAEVYQSLKKLLKSRGKSVAVGDEGGFAPDLQSDEEAISLIIEAIEAADYKPYDDFMISIDAAASEWSEGEDYVLPKQQIKHTSASLTDYWCSICEKYPIFSIEDALGENDYFGWQTITKKLGDKIKLVGDDLFVTDTQRLLHGIENNYANAILIKLNQIGTLSETLEAIRTARRSGYSTIISHRSGETSDTFIADLAVAINAGYIKTGAPCRGERTSKYNRLMEIYSQM